MQLVPNISQGHLEKVKDFLEQGVKVKGLLTEDRIDQLADQKVLTVEYSDDEQNILPV